MQELETLRNLIDKADDSLIDILVHRMDLVEQVARIKSEMGIGVLDRDRERRMLERIGRKAAQRGLDIGLVERLLRSVISHSRQNQNDRRVAPSSETTKMVESFSFQGGNGAYSWIAGKRFYGDTTNGVGFAGFSDALEALEQRVVDAAVLPIQNTLAGSIHEVYSLLGMSRLQVTGEEYLRIDHCLIGLPDTDMSRIKRVFSHPVALRQCKSFIASHPEIEFIASTDTAMSAERVFAEQDHSIAAIASSEAARLHNLSILKGSISDHAENVTRFWMIRINAEEVAGDQAALTSIELVTDHREGALVKCLKVLSDAGINMLKLESHPREGIPWEHSFYLDLEGNINELRLANALDQLRTCTRELRLLGCYRRNS